MSAEGIPSSIGQAHTLDTLSQDIHPRGLFSLGVALDTSGVAVESHQRWKLPSVEGERFWHTASGESEAGAAASAPLKRPTPWSHNGARTSTHTHPRYFHLSEIPSSLQDEDVALSCRSPPPPLQLFTACDGLPRCPRAGQTQHPSFDTLERQLQKPAARTPSRRRSSDAQKVQGIPAATETPRPLPRASSPSGSNTTRLNSLPRTVSQRPAVRSALLFGSVL